MEWLLVGTGGIIGALLRYEITKWMNEKFVMAFPYPTLLINITGAFLLGWFTRSLHIFFPQFSSAPMLLLGVGMCGAYTTFSTFSYETLTLFREHRVFTGLLYVITSCVLGFALSGLGLYGLPSR